MNEAPLPSLTAPQPARSKWLARLHVLLRMAGIFTLTVFLLSAFPILWKIHQHRIQSAQPEDFTHLLNQGNINLKTRVERIAHEQKQGANEFVELAITPFADTALAPSALDKTFENGWRPLSTLDASAASLVGQACRYARSAGASWFPTEETAASGSMSVNVWSASLKHGEMNAVNLLLCDPRAGRLYSANIRIR